MNRPRCHYCDTTGDMLNDVRYREELDVDACDRCAESGRVRRGRRLPRTGGRA